MTLPNRCTHQLLAPNLCVKFSTSLCLLWRSHQPCAHHRITPVMIFSGRALLLSCDVPCFQGLIVVLYFTCNWTDFWYLEAILLLIHKASFVLREMVGESHVLNHKGVAQKLGGWLVCHSGVSAVSVSGPSVLLLAVH